MADHVFFLLGFSFLLTHEMDAIRCQEWRIFPGLARMSERSGYVTFTAIHVPLYAALLWGLAQGDETTGSLITGLDIFFLIHLIAHVLLRHHPENRFGSWFSWSLFTGAGVCGAIDLLLTR